jgi:hypothetical protein
VNGVVMTEPLESGAEAPEFVDLFRAHPDGRAEHPREGMRALECRRTLQNYACVELLVRRQTPDEGINRRRQRAGSDPLQRLVVGDQTVLRESLGKLAIGDNVGIKPLAVTH